MRSMTLVCRTAILAATFGLTAAAAQAADSQPSQIQCQAKNGGFPHLFLSLDKNPAQVLIAESFADPFNVVTAPVGVLVGAAGTRLAGSTLYTVALAADKELSVYLNTQPRVQNSAPFSGPGSIGAPDNGDTAVELTCTAW